MAALQQLVGINAIDKVGRRLLLLVGSVGMSIGLIAASISFTHAHNSGATVSLPPPWGLIALVGANLFVVFFAATWGPVMWLVLGEIFPNRFRGLALGMSTAFNWMFSFLGTLLFPMLSSAVGLGWVYAGFAFFAVVSFVFVKTLLPEDMGLELEDKTKTDRALQVTAS